MDIIIHPNDFYKQASLIHIYAIQHSGMPEQRPLITKEVLRDFKLILLAINLTSPVRKPVTRHLKLRVINRPESGYEFKVSVGWNSERHSMLITRDNQHLLKQWLNFGFKPDTLSRWKDQYGT